MKYYDFTPITVFTGRYFVRDGDVIVSKVWMHEVRNGRTVSTKTIEVGRLESVVLEPKKSLFKRILEALK